MVERTDLQRVNALYAELSGIARGLQVIDQGAEIISVIFAIRSDSDSPWRSPTTVRTEHMDYPPQMVEAIKQFMYQREDQIASELSNLGLQGVEAQPRAARGGKK